MNTAAERIAALFETPPEDRKRLDQLATEIHQKGDLMPHWRPWWPSVGEVWALQGKAYATDPQETQARYTEAWRALLAIFEDYLAHKASGE